MQNERTALGLPDVAPDSLLAVLREVTGARALRFAEAPCRLGAGGEAVVDAFRLAGAPSGFDGPLVVRRLMPLKDASQIQREAVVHRVLAQQGYPVPRVFAAEVSSAALGAPFLIAERLPGKVLLQEIMRPGMVAAHPMRIPRIVYEALVRCRPCSARCRRGCTRSIRRRCVKKLRAPALGRIRPVSTADCGC